MRSDWLLKLAISAIHSPPCIVLGFVREFFLMSQNQRTICYWLSHALKLFISVTVNSGRYLAPAPLRASANIYHCSPQLRWIIVDCLHTKNFSEVIG